MDQSQSGPSRSTVVLVVEDNHLILMSALDLVATAGYEGGKWGVLGQAEARLDPRVFTRVMHDRGPADFFLVARAGGRATLRTVSSCEVEAPCGLNFGALRLSLGATMVLP